MDGSLQFEATLHARTADGRIDDYHSVLVDIEASYDGREGGGIISVLGVDRATPDAEGRYPSTLITSGRWSR